MRQVYSCPLLGRRAQILVSMGQFVSVMIFPPRGSRFPSGKSPSRWREFSFALHQIQSAIEPHLSLRQTLLTWNEIARALAEPPRCRLPQCFDPRW
jgi:hypothetical protein